MTTVPSILIYTIFIVPGVFAAEYLFQSFKRDKRKEKHSNGIDLR